MISVLKIETICNDLFNIQGTATVLPGEIDFNYKIDSTNGKKYILKVSQPEFNLEHLNYQRDLLQFIEQKKKELNAPKVILDIHNNAISSYTDVNGKKRKVRLLTWIEGRLWSHVNPHSKNLRNQLGMYCGKLTQTLIGFKHAYATYNFDWDIAQSLWTKKHIHLFNKDQKEIISYFQASFESSSSSYQNLRKSIVHNDANDNNIIISNDKLNPKIVAVIDYGDAIHTQIINDVAITCTYAIMGFENPLQAALPIINGYHSAFPLKENELVHLYNAIAMRLIISVTKSAINKSEQPHNKYLFISEKPAWNVLKKWRQISSDFAHYSFRKACGLTPIV